MKEERRNFIEDTINHLDILSKRQYSWFEVALVIFLRSDIETFKSDITNEKIEKIETLLNNSGSLMDEYLKNEIDDIIYDED